MPLLASRRRRRHRVPYNEAVMSDAPLAYWRLDDASGNFLDSALNGHAATPSGTITRGVAGALTGDGDTAATFATSAYANAADFATGSEYAFEVWVKAGTQISNNRHLINRDATPTGSTRVAQFVIINSDNATTAIRGQVRAVWFNSTGANALCYGPARVDDGAWHHVVFVVSGSTGTVWVDGVAGTPATLAGVIRGSGSALGLAQTSTQAGGMSGGLTLDEVAVYGWALSPTRIAAHYAAGRGL